MPTVLDYMGLPVPEEVQGESLRPLIAGSGDWEAKPSYFESMALTLKYNWASPRGIYVGNYKYIDLPIPELYDMEVDFNENHNLWEAEPKLASSLRDRLQELLEARSQSGSTTVQPRTVDHETLEKLRALGYAGGSYTASVSSERRFSKEDDPKRLIDFLNQLEDARTFFQMGRPDDAIEIYEHLIDWRPEFALAYASLAYVYGELGRLPKAIEVLEAAYQRGVRSDMVLVRLGTYLREVGRLERSEAVLKSALEEYPDHVGAQNSLGLTYYRQGRAEEAIRIFNELLRTDPSLVSTHSNLGTVYLSQRRYALALAEFQRVLELDPRAAEALNGMGVVYASTGRPQEAIRSWKEAVALDPRRFDTLLNLGMLLAQQKRFADATLYLNRFAETAPLPRYEKDVTMVKKLLGRLPPTNH
jgi:tetratricopeptide (TPR) repeat protein